MMLKKCIHTKGRKLLSFMLSVLLVLSLGLFLLPVDAHAEGEALPEETTAHEFVTPEVTEPEATILETTEPETTEPEVTEPEVTEPEVTEPEVTEPEITEPEVTEPEVTPPEESEPKDFIVTLTLTFKERSLATTTYKGYALYAKTGSEDGIYPLDFGKVKLPAGTYALYKDHAPYMIESLPIGIDNTTNEFSCTTPDEITIHLKWTEAPKICEHFYSDEWICDETGETHFHECIFCGERIDEAVHDDSGEWQKNEAEHWKVCTVCGITLPYSAHTFGKDWISDDTSHWHVCECGEKSDINKHTPSDWITDLKPSTFATGSKHTECTTCKKVLETKELPKLIAPKIVAGMDQTYQQRSQKNLTLTCSGHLQDLTGVYVAGGLVHPSNYIVDINTQTVALKSNYLDSLGGGTHTLELTFNNGISAKTTFTIPRTTAVKTGDQNNYLPLVILLILSGGVFVTTAVIHKKGWNG